MNVESAHKRAVVEPDCYNHVAMGYRLEADESVPKGLRRVVREEIECAQEHFSGKQGDPDEAIHEARKSIKKIRAVLRLVQDELGPTYQKENAALRAVAADLSEIRDAAAIIETIDQLPGAAAEFGPVRQALVERKKQTDVLKDRDAVMKEAALGLRRLEKRVKTWPLGTTGFAAIAPGLESRYRRGRRAMKTAADQQTPECFHEWRKRVKDHWYHTRLIESLWTGEMQAREKSLKELETWLGDDHNLFVLRSRISAEPAAFGEPGMVDSVLETIDKRQKELRRNAASLGARLYDEKPKAFTHRVARLWKEWQTRPRDLEKEEVESGKQDTATRKPAAKAGKPTQGKSRVA